MENGSISASLRQKQPRLKLAKGEFEIILENLHVHHMKRRSQLGGDVMDNLITLCAPCHWKCHRGAHW